MFAVGQPNILFSNGKAKCFGWEWLAVIRRNYKNTKGVCFTVVFLFWHLNPYKLKYTCGVKDGGYLKPIIWSSWNVKNIKWNYVTLIIRCKILWSDLRNPTAVHKRRFKELAYIIAYVVLVCFNLLEPTGYVMHQQFNKQRLVPLTA